MHKKGQGDQVALICDVCGKEVTEVDELRLLETAAKKGWIGYYPEDPHHHVKFTGRQPLHFCSIDCEEKALNIKTSWTR